MDWHNALQAVRHFQLPRTRALHEELAALHAEHSSVSGELLEVRSALEQTRTEDAREIETLQHRLEQLTSDRDGAREQTRLLERSLQEARERQSATEQRLAALESQLEDARHQHESNLYLTKDALSRLQSEQHNLLSLQSDMARTFHEYSQELLKSLQAQARPRMSVLQMAVVAGLLFLSGALATSLVLNSSRDTRVDLSGISSGIQELQQLMRTHFRTHDELLETLRHAVGARDGSGGSLPDSGAVPAEPLSATDSPQDLLRGQVQRNERHALPDDAATLQQQRDLQTLGLLPGPGGDMSAAALQLAMQRFDLLYPAPAGDAAAGDTGLHRVAEQARADAARYRLDSPVVAAIRLGSERTGVEFSYLMELAEVESSFNPSARAETSTAAGMYQFKDETWLDAVRRYGERYGLGYYASRIKLLHDDSGEQQLYIADPEVRQRVLDLRLNPRLSALLAAEQVRNSRQRLSSLLAHEPARTDLYLSHFFGTTGAISFLKALAEDPEQIAGEMFPGPAQRNRSIFRKRNDKPRTMAEVYRLLNRKFNTARYEEG